MKDDLRENPPQRFDIARQWRAFNAAFQFVELTMSGTSIGRRTVRIPNHLLGVADEATRRQLRTVLNVVPSDHELGGRSVEARRHRLVGRYLRVIPGFGYVVVRKDKEAFLTELEALKQTVAVFKDRVTAKLSVELDKRAAESRKH